MFIIKRNGKKEIFDVKKIENAILKAMEYGSGCVDKEKAYCISRKIHAHYFAQKDIIPTVRQVEKMVYDLLIECGHSDTARYYEGYRAVAEFKRQVNTNDDSILGLIDGTNKTVMNENSNKNAKIAPTQRDLVAGEVSKDIARRRLLPTRIIQAHDNGILHYHDMDYAMQSIFNCCLVNIKDMLDNGTVINGKMIESPNSFQVACTVMTQIMAQISSGQYGGQSMNVKHLGKYLAKSKKKYESLFDFLQGEEKEKAVNSMLKKELEAGVQTIQYQINTLMTTNGLL